MRALVRDAGREREGAAPGLLTDRFEDIRDDPSIKVVAEVMGGVEPTLGYLRELLERGVSVVSANKQLLARHGAELQAAADRGGAQLRYEASACAAIPVVRVLQESLAAAGVDELIGIVNGTTNFMLTAMARDGRSYADALAEAQQLGYAEADPTEDVGGADAAAKLAILASLAFHRHLHIDDVPFEGIDTLHDDDVAFASELGYAVKLLAHARLSGDGIAARVGPVLVPDEHPLARVSGSFNAVMLRGREIREITLQGPGAGGAETATAVIGDLLSVLQPAARRRGRDGVPRAAARAAEPRAQPALRAPRGQRPSRRAGPDRRALRRARHLARRHDPAAPRRRARLARLPDAPCLRGERPRGRRRNRNARLLPRPAARPARARRVTAREGLLQSGDGRRLLVAQLFDALGAGVGIVALPWLVLDAGASASTAGLVAVFGLIPYVLFGLFAGVTGDRRSRRKVIVAAHVTQTACALAVTAWALSGTTPVWLVLGAAFSIGIARTFADASAFGAIAQIVGPAQFGPAQGLLSTVWATGMVSGPALGGQLIGSFGPSRAISVQCGAFGLAALCARDDPEPAAAPASRTSAACGRRFARASTSSCHTPVVRMITLTTLVWNLAFYGSEAPDRPVPARRHPSRRRARGLGARRRCADRRRHRADDPLARRAHRAAGR